MTLSGKVVVVTGGGAGIGAAVARLAAERGAQVAVLDVEADAGSATLVVRCDVGRESGRERRVRRGAGAPRRRLAAPEEPARAALWLLSDEASYVTGSHLFCDGGVTAKASISV